MHMPSQLLYRQASNALQHLLNNQFKLGAYSLFLNCKFILLSCNLSSMFVHNKKAPCVFTCYRICQVKL